MDDNSSFYRCSTGIAGVFDDDREGGWPGDEGDHRGGGRRHFQTDAGVGPDGGRLSESSQVGSLHRQQGHTPLDQQVTIIGIAKPKQFSF